MTGDKAKIILQDDEYFGRIGRIVFRSKDWFSAIRFPDGTQRTYQNDQVEVIR